MTTASVLAADAVPASAAPLHVGLRTVLIIAALLEGFDAASSVPTLFGDMSEIPGPGFQPSTAWSGSSSSRSASASTGSDLT
jgi:hypothetical protein